MGRKLGTPKTPGAGGAVWQKGQSGNPRGAQLHNQDLKKLRQLTHQDIADVGGLVLKQNKAELERIKKDPTSTILRAWFASVALAEMARGQGSHFSLLLDRIVGKVKEKVELTGKDGSPLIPADEDLRKQRREEILLALKELNDGERKA